MARFLSDYYNNNIINGTFPLNKCNTISFPIRLLYKWHVFFCQIKFKGDNKIIIGWLTSNEQSQI